MRVGVRTAALVCGGGGGRAAGRRVQHARFKQHIEGRVVICDTLQQRAACSQQSSVQHGTRANGRAQVVHTARSAGAWRHIRVLRFHHGMRRAAHTRTLCRRLAHFLHTCRAHAWGCTSNSAAHVRWYAAQRRRRRGSAEAAAGIVLPLRAYSVCARGRTAAHASSRHQHNAAAKQGTCTRKCAQTNYKRSCIRVHTYRRPCLTYFCGMRWSGVSESMSLSCQLLLHYSMV